MQGKPWRNSRPRGSLPQAIGRWQCLPRHVTQRASRARLLRDERAVYDCWRELVAKYGIQGKQAHDARLVAAMQRHGITHLLTFNTSDFSRYPGITGIDPETVAVP